MKRSGRGASLGISHLIVTRHNLVALDPPQQLRRAREGATVRAEEQLDSLP
jgi:hypothetical protein